MLCKSRRAFTLIELLVVIAIIGILASILLPMCIAAITRARMAATKSTIEGLDLALQEYLSDHGRYPPSDSAFSSAPLVTHLDGDTANGGPKKMYFEFTETQLSGGELIDVWGRTMYYRENLTRLQAKGVTSKPARVTTGGELDPDKTDGVNWRSHDVWSHGDDPADLSGWIGSWD